MRDVPAQRVGQLGEIGIGHVEIAAVERERADLLLLVRRAGRQRRDMPLARPRWATRLEVVGMSVDGSRNLE
jgi:hypothetical protein